MSILVKPAAGGNAVLLNVPRNVAVKVKVGTTLSFSASNNQKYTVLDNKMHAPVGRGPQQKRQGQQQQQQLQRQQPRPQQQQPRPQQPQRSGLPVLPRGVSIRPIVNQQRAPQRPFIQQQKKRPPPSAPVPQPS